MHEAGGRRQDELDRQSAAAFVHERDERFREGVLVVARGLDRKDERGALLEADHAARGLGLAVAADQRDVWIQVFEWSADCGLQAVRRGDHEPDRRVVEPVDLKREVLGSAPEALVPAYADRARD